MEQALSDGNSDFLGPARAEPGAKHKVGLRLPQVMRAMQIVEHQLTDVLVAFILFLGEREVHGRSGPIGEVDDVGLVARVCKTIDKSLVSGNEWRASSHR